MKCSQAWSALYVQADGKVSPCCADIPFGTTEESLQEVFTGDRANKLRSQMLENSKSLPNVCKNCSLLQRRGADDFPKYEMAASYDSLSNSYRDEELPDAENKPMSLMVQFGELCNIKCIMCPQDHLSPLGISPKSVQRVKEAIPSIGQLTMTGGEPTAFKQCWEIIDFFNKNAAPGAKLGILTNLKSVNRQRLEKYFSDIDELSIGINIDAATKTTYEYIRRGANWEQLNRNLTDLLDYQAKTGKQHWRVYLTVTLMKSNLHEMVDVIRWAGRLGIGFGCGPMTGDYTPVKNARTYFEENIFRYPHTDVSKDEMMSVFDSAMSETERLPEKYRAGARNNIAGMIAFANTTEQIVIPAALVEKIRLMPDAELSATLGNIVNTGLSGKPSLSDPAGWARYARYNLRKSAGRIVRRLDMKMLTAAAGRVKARIDAN